MKIPISEHSIEDHQPFDGATQRERPAMPIVRLTNCLIKRLVMEVVEPRGVVPAATRSHVLPRDELLEAFQIRHQPDALVDHTDELEEELEEDELEADEE